MKFASATLFMQDMKTPHCNSAVDGICIMNEIHE